MKRFLPLIERVAKALSSTSSTVETVVHVHGNGMLEALIVSEYRSFFLMGWKELSNGVVSEFPRGENTPSHKS